MTNSFPQAIQVISAKRSDLGQKRSNNEDFALAFEPNDPARLEQSGCLYIVADGVGGSREGERASQYAAERVLNEYYTFPDRAPADRLRFIIRDTGNALYDGAEQAGLGHTATTIVAAVVQGSWLTVANVGDSRAYLIRGGQVQQITHDHNQLSELIRMGAISDADAQRSTARNTLTRSLGGQRDVEVDIFENILLNPGDLVLLCTDGLSRYTPDERIASIASSGAPEEICQRMVNFANQSGGEDNITVLVVAAYAVEPLAAHKNVPPAMRRAVSAPAAGSGQPDRLKHPAKMRKSTLAPWQVALLYGAIGLVAVTFLIFMGALLMQYLGRGAAVGGQSTAAVDPSSQTSTPKMKLETQSSGLLPIVTVLPSQPPPTAWPPVSTPTGGAPGDTVGVAAACVREVASGDYLSTILKGFNLGYNEAEKYYYYQTCTDKACTGKKLLIEKHASISLGWFVVIEPIDPENCTKNGGKWVKITQ